MAASPLFATLASCTEAVPEAGSVASAATPTNPADALDVFDLERVAEGKIPLAHWAYLQTGTDGEIMLRRNREGFERLYIRPRRLVGVAEIDMRARLFGKEWSSPIIMAPVASQRGFHPDGELAVARAAAATNHLQVLAHPSSTSVEEANEARGEPVWFQLYASGSWNVNEAVIRRVEAAGCPALVVTVDNPGGSNRITAQRGRQADTRDCASCHVEGRRKPNSQGLPEPEGTARRDSLTWDFIARVRDATQMKLVLKGIMIAEDARLCLRHGADAVWVSNHGGRTDPSAQATIDALPEIVRAVGGRVPVIVDSGVRWGADVFKALALGAGAVAIGRPYIWGLGAFGQQGVERTLEILTQELRHAMRISGTPTLADIGPSLIGGPA
jgi:isopentenyl diphosphate isomerase/L-lactate dehydrogenase-like FMN-dependent dehydrogenase